MAYEQPKLGFEYDALEPHVDALTMETHYAKHHATYCKNYNDLIKDTEYEKISIEEVIKNVRTIPEEQRTAIENQGGGALNHSFFFSHLCPEKESGEPGPQTKKLIEESFEDFDKFKEEFSQAATTVFGSGWAWLCVNNEGKLEIVKTLNQANPTSFELGYKPIMTIDVWEHAYYLKYKNLRPEWIKNFFNIINWKQVETYLTAE